MTLPPPGSPVAVVGAGTMGAGIALVAAQSGHPVRLLDVREGAARGRGRRRCAPSSTSLAERGKVDPDDARLAGERLAAARRR